MRIELEDKDNKDNDKINSSYEILQNAKEASYQSDDTNKSKLKSEVLKFKSLNSKQKVQYFKDYYLFPLLIILFLVFCICWFLHDAFFSQKNILYAGGAVGCQISDEGEQILSQGFLNTISNNPDKDEIQFSKSITLTYDEVDAYNDQSTDVAVVAMMAAGDFNYLLIGEYQIDHYANMGAFINISEYADMFNISEENLYCDREGIPVAIKLDDSVKHSNGILSNTNVYIGFINVKKTSDYDDEFLSYLFR